MWHVPREGCADVCWGPSARTPTRTAGGAYGARSVRGVCRNGLEDACWGQGVPIEQFPWAGCTEICRGPHANLPTEAAGGTPSEHEPCEGCADFFRSPHPNSPVGPYVDLHLDTYGAQTARGACRHGPSPACEPAQWGRGSSSISSTIRVRGVPKWIGAGPHANSPAGAANGTPSGAQSV